MRIDRDLDRLYQLPREEFVAARNALVKTLRAAGRREAAARVAAAAKPTASAWLVNRLYGSSRREFDRLLRTGRRLRDAQQAGTKRRAAGDLRRLLEQRRAALAALLELAEAVQRELGRPAGRDLLRRVETPRDAIATQAGPGPDQRLGRLVRDLDPPGFEVALSLTAAAGAPAPASPRARSRSGSPPRAGAAAERAAGHAARCKTAADRAAAALRTAEARLEAAVQEQRDLKRRLQRSASRVKHERAELRRARAAARRAAAALDKAIKVIE